MICMNDEYNIEIRVLKVDERLLCDAHGCCSLARCFHERVADEQHIICKGVPAPCDVVEGGLVCLRTAAHGYGKASFRGCPISSSNLSLDFDSFHCKLE